jgi:hypothetical protein
VRGLCRAAGSGWRAEGRNGTMNGQKIGFHS